MKKPAIVLVIGITVLLAKFIPFGSMLVGTLLAGLGEPASLKAARTWVSIAMLLADYLPAAVVAFLFVRRMDARLPDDGNGTTPTLIGLGLLVLAKLSVLLLALAVGGPGAFVVAAMLVPLLFLIPGYLLIIFGVGKALLALRPPAQAAAGEAAANTAPASPARATERLPGA